MLFGFLVLLAFLAGLAERREEGGPPPPLRDDASAGFALALDAAAPLSGGAALAGGMRPGHQTPRKLIWPVGW